jgi:hypothetical protein
MNKNKFFTLPSYRNVLVEAATKRVRNTSGVRCTAAAILKEAETEYNAPLLTGQKTAIEKARFLR